MGYPKSILYNICSIIFSIVISIFVIRNNPLVLGLLLIIISLTLRLLIFILYNSPWIPYIIILVFSRGVIIIFLYITRLTPNEPLTNFLRPIKITVLFFVSFILSICIFSNIKIINLRILRNLKLEKISNIFSSIYKTYNPLTSEITLVLIVYLLIVLIIAVNVTTNNNNPLRKK